MQTALQEFIYNAKIAKQHSKDGYVTYNEVIEVATDLLEKEKQQIKDAWQEGYYATCENEENNSHGYFDNTFNQ